MFLKRALLCIGAIVLGCLPALWLIYNAPPTHHLFAKKLISMLEENWDAHIDIPQVKFNLLNGTIQLCNGKVIPKKLPSCSWEFDQCILSIDRFTYLTRKTLLIDVFFNSIEITSTMQNKKPLILNHFATILFAPDTSPPIHLTSLHAQHIILNAANTNNSYSCTISGATSFNKNLCSSAHPLWQGSSELKDGHLHINGTNLLHHATGKLYYTYTSGTYWNLQGSITCVAQGKNHQSPLKTTIDITDNKGSIVIKDNEPPRGITSTSVGCSAQGSEYTDPTAGNAKGLHGELSQIIRMNDHKVMHNGAHAEVSKHQAPSLYRGALSTLRHAQGERSDAKTLTLQLLLSDATILKGTLPLTKLASFYHLLVPHYSLSQFEPLLTSTQSLLNLHVTIPHNPAPSHGTFHIAPIAGLSFPNAQLEASWNFQDSRLSSSLHLSSSLSSLAHANITWDTQKQQFSCSGQITHPLTFNQWEITQASLNADIHKSKGKALHGTYKAHYTSRVHKKNTWSGSLFVHNNELNIAGNSYYNAYVLRILLQPFSLTTLKYTHHGEKVIDINAHPNNKVLQGDISYAFVRSLLPEHLQNMLLGSQGTLRTTLDQSYPRIRGSLELKDSKLAILDSCNMLRSGTSDFIFDVQERMLTLCNLNLLFYKGKMHFPELIASFNPSWSLNHLHAPCLVEDVLFNWKRDFYGLLYGTLLFEKADKGSLLTSGNLVVKKSLLKENIFATHLERPTIDQSAWQKTTHDTNKLTLHVQTEQSLHTKTPFLDTYANFDLNIDLTWPYSNLTNPTVHGDITLHKGCLQLGKHMLWITSGLIRFIPNQMGETVIDVIARNKIKKYLITLTATGSLQKPTVLLESTPYLNEEQIIALLFSGSENASLQADLPAMLMQNLHKMLVGSNITLPQATTWFERITKPLKYIQITPHFTDQSGRGGIRGTVSVDLNSKLHAQFQKNFTLQEDFSFQLEYYFTDDINVKIIRDQRGDLGSEVEVRMKL